MIATMLPKTCTAAEEVELPNLPPSETIISDPYLCYLDLSTLPDLTPLIRADPYAPQIEASDAAWKADISDGAAAAVRKRRVDLMLPERLAAQSDQQWAKADENLKARAKWLDWQILNTVAGTSELCMHDGLENEYGPFEGSGWPSSLVIGPELVVEAIAEQRKQGKVKLKKLKNRVCGSKDAPAKPPLKIRKSPSGPQEQQKRQKRNLARRRNAAKISYTALYDRIDALRLSGVSVTQDKLSQIFQRYGHY
eukprot:SAG31_NODE_3991_length_3680_cov_3.034627_3_plen_252_part_00